MFNRIPFLVIFLAKETTSQSNDLQFARCQMWSKSRDADEY